MLIDILSLSGTALGTAGIGFALYQASRNRQLQQALQEATAKSEAQIEARTQAVTRMEDVQAQLERSVRERDAALAAREETEQLRQEAVRDAALFRQKMDGMEQRMQDWEKVKAEHFKASKEAMFETGLDVFRKQSKEFTDNTMKEFGNLSELVARLKGEVGDSQRKTDTLWRTLTSPGGAGQMAEIGLANTLISFGLEQGRDFVMQYSVDGEESGKKLRPDAVVFLPQGSALVIDSKASRFFVEIAQTAEQPESQESALASLKKTMHEHLKTLATKGYQDAVKAYHKTTEHAVAIAHTVTVMYLPTESAVETLYKADPTFRMRAQELGILIAGPTGLAGLMSLAQVEITRAYQEKHYDTILEEVGTLLGNLGTVLGYAQAVGKGIESSAKAYQKFTRSVNSRLLSKARKVQEMGVPLPHNKSLPAPLADYHITTESAVIEGEADDEVKRLEVA
jgi:DNA recombination protein RmuC